MEVAAGKLFILGGGWDRLYVSQLHSSIMVRFALKLSLRWTGDDEAHPLAVRLSHAHGSPEMRDLPPASLAVQQQTVLASGTQPGDYVPFLIPLELAFVAEWQGRYTVTVMVDDRPVGESCIEVVLQDGAHPRERAAR